MEKVRQHFKNAAEHWQKCVNIFEMFAKACSLVREPVFFLKAFRDFQGVQRQERAERRQKETEKFGKVGQVSEGGVT
jgi:hypothetical protein